MITPQCGGDSEKDTPVTMPNTEVKLLSADCSEGLPLVRVGRRHANGEKQMNLVHLLFYLHKLRENKKLGIIVFGIVPSFFTNKGILKQ